LCDFERWSASRDASKAAASAVEEEQAASEANAAIQAKDALRAEAEAKAEATAQNLRQRFLSIQSGLEKTTNELQGLRLRAAAALSHAEASNPSTRSCTTIARDSYFAENIAPVLSQTRAVPANRNAGTALDLAAKNESP
jgi:hypothetical protein